jgi:phenylalanyl-tRNA synthetase beta chain
MRFTLSWLKRFLDTNASIDNILDGLNSIGLEVEDVSTNSNRFVGFKIAHIVEANPHPAADKLKVCKVNDGQNILQIVCGAENARSGIKVVLASVGAIVPANGMKISVSKIRNVESFGMLCSGDELLLEGHGSGIIELDCDAPIGESFAKYYDLDDPVIEVAITPNRGDCLGVYGIARDLQARGLGLLKEIQISEISNSFTSNIKVEVEDSSICPLFIGRQVKGVTNKASPIWLQNLLRNSGLKPISSIVDITNYICHSFAQPMHAFDADKVDSISVKMATEGESFDALNDKTYKLSSKDVVISSSSSAECLAGIIGGKNSATNLDTSNIFLEAACFDKDLLTLSARRHEILTQSRLRFERHVDYHWRVDAFKIACAMIAEICGGQFAQTSVVGGLKPLEEVEFCYSDFKKKIGIELAPSLIDEILNKLGYKITSAGDGVALISVPSWRDSKISEDIVEEIIRIHGYDKIVEQPLPDTAIATNKPKSLNARRILGPSMVSMGYAEAVTWSFMSSKKAQNFGEINPQLMVVNPISSDLNYMRATIVPNLLDGILKNQNRSIKDLKFFEIGPVFSGLEIAQETRSLAAVITGSNTAQNPHEKARSLDVFDLKGDLEYLLKDFGITFDDIEIRKTDKPYYHPNVAAQMIYEGKNIGTFGAIHPRILKSYDINSDVFAFELNIDELSAKNSKQEYVSYEFQQVERDFAFVINEDVAIGDVLKGIKKIDAVIKDLKIFDIYKGQGIADGKKSVAINVLLKSDHNLLSDEINDVCKRIIDFMKDSYLADLRGQ